MLETLAEAVSGTPFALWAAQAPLAYPIANVLHVLGLALLLGPIALLDIRIMGVFRGLPLPALAQATTSLVVVGLFLLLLSGPVLFAADARALVQSGVFRLKLLLLGAALLNALLFRLLWQRRMLAGDDLPSMAGLVALASLGLWTAIAVLGRWIAYAA